MARTRLELIEGLLKIRNKQKVVVPFRLNVAQTYYWNRRTRRNILLKARQKGLTKIIDADQFIQCIERTTKAVVISHEKEATKRLFADVKFYFDNLTVKPEVLTDTTSMMTFPKRGSSFFVGTAGQKALGRGDTIDRAHLSEAAFYPDLEGTLAGVSEAAEYGQIDIESTPNGREAFYDLWQKAKSGKSPYTPIFIPWFIDLEYSADTMPMPMILGLSEPVQEMFAVPDDEWDWPAEEQALYKRVLFEHGIKLTVGQLKWRRYKIWDKGDLFFQEYPEDDESCFLQSGRSVFKIIRTDTSLRVPLDSPELLTAEDRARLLTPGKRKPLYGGIDPSEGVEGGDQHVFSVLEPMPKTGKAHVIYEYASTEPIDVFALKVSRICKTFNIQLAVEKQGVGVAMCRALDRLGVSFEEWNTTATTRPVIITDLEEAYRKEELIESYPEAEAEARNMRYNQKNRPEHPPGKHDDRIFSRGIALQQMKQPAPSVEFF